MTATLPGLSTQVETSHGTLKVDSGLLRYDTRIRRRPTRTVMVGHVPIGSNHPVVVQSMINEDTMDIPAAVAGIRRLADAGCEIVRVTVPSLSHAKAMGHIRQQLRDQGCMAPLVADVHHNGINIALAVAQHVDKVRINPGLFVFDRPDPDRQSFSAAEFAAAGQRIRTTFGPLVELLKEQNKALRIGVNHGSLAERMVFTHGDTPQGMAESAMEFIRICGEMDFHNIVVSMKASRAAVMLAAYRLVADAMDAEGFNYPLHLGVTEAGMETTGASKALPASPPCWRKAWGIPSACPSRKRRSGKSPWASPFSRPSGCGKPWWSTWRAQAVDAPCSTWRRC